MGLAFLSILAIPLIWIFIAKYIWHDKITIQEMLAQAIVVSIITFAVYGIGKYSAMNFIEVINGEVTGKEQVRVSCTHSYSCRCTTDSEGNTSCDTCYDHFADYDWRVYTNVGNFNINRVNRQGTRTPPRWNNVKNGEPVALPHLYINYVKASDSSLFNKKEFGTDNVDDENIPKYPLDFYDYYHIDRAIVIGKGIKIDATIWSDKISTMLKTLGPKKQANVIIVFASNVGPEFINKLERAWMGANKNDIVIGIGVDNNEFSWANIYSWSKNEMFNITLRDELTELKSLDPDKVMPIISKVTMKHFVRREMAEFEYLKDEIEPSTTSIIIGAILALLSSIGLTIFFLNNELTLRGFSRRNRNIRY